MSASDSTTANEGRATKWRIRCLRNSFWTTTQRERMVTLVARTASQEPEHTPLGELDQLTARTETDDEIRQLERRLTDIHQHINDLDATEPAPAESAGIVGQHCAQLHQRRHEIESQISTLEARCTLATWQPTTDPAIAARIERRIDQLVHAAAMSRSEWAVKLITGALGADEPNHLEGAIEAFRHTAARAERDATRRVSSNLDPYELPTTTRY